MQLDGDTEGPVRHANVLKKDDDILAEAGLRLIQEYLSKEKGPDGEFGILGLTSSPPEEA